MLQSWHSLLISLAELETGLYAFLVIFVGSNSVKTNLVHLLGDPGMVLLILDWFGYLCFCLIQVVK